MMQLIKKVGGKIELYSVPTLTEHELCTVIAKNERKLADAHHVCYLTPTKAELCSMLCLILRTMDMRLVSPDEVLTAIYKVDADTYCDPKSEATNSKLCKFIDDIIVMLINDNVYQDLHIFPPTFSSQV